jgi:hypothetical protein
MWAVVTILTLAGSESLTASPSLDHKYLGIKRLHLEPLDVKRISVMIRPCPKTTSTAS